MSIGQSIPPFGDVAIPITQATNGVVGGIGQILVAIFIASSTSGTLTIGTTKLGTLLSAFPVTAGQTLQIPFKIPPGDQLTITGGGTLTGVVLMQNP